MWVDITGYKYRYRISTEGVVQKLDGEKWITLSQRIGKTRAFVDMWNSDNVRVKVPVVRLMANAFLGGQKKGYAVIHINGAKLDNGLTNLQMVPHKEAARLSSGNRRRPVEKIDRDGNVIEVYRSQVEAARKNYMSKNSVSIRCLNRVKDPYKLMGYTFRYAERNGNLKYYEVRDALTGEMLAHGTSWECMKQLKCASLDSFYALANRSARGKNKKYIVTIIILVKYGL